MVVSLESLSVQANNARIIPTMIANRKSFLIIMAAPEFGQHTEEVLLESGLTWDAITRLRDEEII